MQVNKNGLCEILGISKDWLKKVEMKGELGERLKATGYELLGKVKKGRSVFYNINLTNEDIKVYANTCKYIYGTDNKEGFKNYFITRTENCDKPVAKSDISQIANVSEKTVGRWDSILIDNNMISKDGWFYFSVKTIKNKKTLEQCSKYEYDSFWKNCAELKEVKKLKEDYENNEITLEEYSQCLLDMGATVYALKDKYFFRIKKYKLNHTNGMYISTKRLIESIYNKKIDNNIEVQYSIE